MLPTLSRLSVSNFPDSRLRHRCSSQYLRISPLHWPFRYPLQHSILAVSTALPWLSQGLSQSTYEAAYTRFTPNNSEQRLHPLYYRGCWHRVSRCFLCRYRQTHTVLSYEISSRPTVLYDPKAFIPHAASLRQAFAHCAKFPVAATRRCRFRVSVTLWPIMLSHRLTVVVLVSHYLTN